jgi:nucleoside-diphosphate-sugar epimerase
MSSNSKLDNKILVIGGSCFIGKHIVEKLISNNYEVTTINRRITEVQYTASVQRIKADRNNYDEFISCLKSKRQIRKWIAFKLIP